MKLFPGHFSEGRETGDQWLGTESVVRLLYIGSQLGTKCRLLAVQTIDYHSSIVISICGLNACAGRSSGFLRV
jgi:hypothetical protein